MPHPAGKSCRDSAPENLAGGGLCCVFCMGVRGSRVARLPGRQARTSTGYGFGRRRVSALRFPTDALRFRLFSKGILPAATVFVPVIAGVEIRHLLGEYPAHDSEEGPAAVVGGVFDRVCEQCLEIVVDRTDDRLGLCRIRSRGYLFLRSGGFCGGCLRSNVFRDGCFRHVCFGCIAP